MTTAVQHRRGTTAEHSTFTGLEGEVTIDTTKDTAVIHDGSLAGGYPLAKETLANVNPSTLSAITGAATASDDLFLMYDTSALSMKKISRAELNNAITIEALDTVDINGGTIDGTTIGGTTAAAGTFTTGQFNTSLNVDGTATMDGLTVDSTSGAEVIISRNDTSLDNGDFIGGIKFGTNDSSTAYGTPPHYSAGIKAKSSGTVGLMNLHLYAGQTNDAYEEDTPSMTLYATGDVALGYEDTGTTPKLFWDASAESLGIGTSSPSELLTIGAGTTSVNSVLYLNGGSDSTKGAGIKLAKAGTAFAFIGSVSWLLGGTSSNLGFSANSSATNVMQLDSSGNLGLGVTPSAWTSNIKSIQIANSGTSLSAGNTTYSGTSHAFLTSNGYFDGTNWIYSRSTTSSQYYQIGNEHRWQIAPSGTAGNAISFTQAMKLDASGNLLVGTTSSNPIVSGVVGLKYFASVGVLQVNGNAEPSLELGRFTSTGDIASFYYAGTKVGSISVTGSATAYNTSSDYRLKEDIQPMSDATSRVLALNPVNFAWKADGSRVDGFIAHEAQAVVPEAVTGEKDAVDDEGNPQYQGIDQSKLVPVLTKALQEALARIDSLESRLAAAGL